MYPRKSRGNKTQSVRHFKKWGKCPTVHPRICAHGLVSGLGGRRPGLEANTMCILQRILTAVGCHEAMVLLRRRLRRRHAMLSMLRLCSTHETKATITQLYRGSFEFYLERHQRRNGLTTPCCFIMPVPFFYRICSGCVRDFDLRPFDRPRLRNDLLCVEWDVNPFNASCFKLLLCEGFSAILVQPTIFNF